jgi:hypothetical protein
MMERDDPLVVMIGVGLNAATVIHSAVAEKRPTKFVKERALTVTSKGKKWVDVNGLGCSNGFMKLRNRLPQDDARTNIGLADAHAHRMKDMIKAARNLLGDDPKALDCDNESCISCRR